MAWPMVESFYRMVIMVETQFASSSSYSTPSTRISTNESRWFHYPRQGTTYSLHSPLHSPPSLSTLPMGLTTGERHCPAIINQIEIWQLYKTLQHAVQQKGRRSRRWRDKDRVGGEAHFMVMATVGPLPPLPLVRGVDIPLVSLCSPSATRM